MEDKEETQPEDTEPVDIVDLSEGTEPVDMELDKDLEHTHFVDSLDRLDKGLVHIDRPTDKDLVGHKDLVEDDTQMVEPNRIHMLNSEQMEKMMDLLDTDW